MQRLHVHISVDDLATARQFYSTLFGAQPTVVKPDYAKWLLDDPRVNLAISQREGRAPGIDHLGVQADSAEEFAALHGRLTDVSYPTLAENAAQCCYARSDKQWVVDTAGVSWELFHTFGESATYGEDPAQSDELPAPASPGPAGESCGCSCGVAA